MDNFKMFIIFFFAEVKNRNIPLDLFIAQIAKRQTHNDNVYILQSSLQFGLRIKAYNRSNQPFYWRHIMYPPIYTLSVALCKVYCGRKGRHDTTVVRNRWTPRTNRLTVEKN